MKVLLLILLVGSGAFADVGYLQKDNNLSDVNSGATARVNLGMSIEEETLFVVNPDDTTYTLVRRAGYARTVDSLALACVGGGSLTAELQIDTVADSLCTALSVTSTELNTTCDGDTLAVGQDLEIAVTSNAGCNRLSATILTTR